MSNSADHLVTSSLSQLSEDPEAILPFHEHVKNSAAHKFLNSHAAKSSSAASPNAVTICSDSSSDVNVIGTAVRIQVWEQQQDTCLE